jgi:hypothetical protein
MIRPNAIKRVSPRHQKVDLMLEELLIKQSLVLKASKRVTTIDEGPHGYIHQFSREEGPHGV